jgi:hypothetical protein
LDQIVPPGRGFPGADGEVHACAVEGSQLEILPSLRHSILVETPLLVTDLCGFLLGQRNRRHVRVMSRVHKSMRAMPANLGGCARVK